MATKVAIKKPVTATKTKQQLSTNNYVVLMVIIAVLATIAGVYFGYQMVKENIRNGQVLIGKVQAQNDVTKKLENAQKLVDNYNRLSGEQKQLIQAAMPSKADFTQMISLMEVANSSAGTRMESINANASAAASSAATGSPADSSGASGTQSAGGSVAPQPLPVSVSVQGNYGQMTRLFRNLEMSTRPISVATFELKGNSGLLKGDLTLQTFYQGEADYSDKEETVK